MVLHALQRIARSLSLSFIQACILDRTLLKLMKKNSAVFSRTSLWHPYSILSAWEHINACFKPLLDQGTSIKTRGMIGKQNMYFFYFFIAHTKDAHSRNKAYLSLTFLSPPQHFNSLKRQMLLRKGWSQSLCWNMLIWLQHLMVWLPRWVIKAVILERHLHSVQVLTDCSNQWFLW